MNRLEIATRILQGLVSNPAVVAANGITGWGVVNISEERLCEYALGIADDLLEVHNKQDPNVNPIPRPSDLPPDPGNPWWCCGCGQWLPGIVVTNVETHDTRRGGCGGKCV